MGREIGAVSQDAYMQAYEWFLGIDTKSSEELHVDIVDTSVRLMATPLVQALVFQNLPTATATYNFGERS